jgi:integrase
MIMSGDRSTCLELSVSVDQSGRSIMYGQRRGRARLRELGGLVRWDLDDVAGLPPIRLHDLRHGAASLMLAGGVSMKTVQETLGHSSLVLTANTYTSVYPEVATAAAEAAAAIVPRAGRASDGRLG